jgi:uncharacterized RDD family membrane protein YckC
MFVKRYSEDTDMPEWGGATYYFELSATYQAVNEMVFYQNGSVRVYSAQHQADEFGKLPEKPLASDPTERAEWEAYRIEESEFKQAWEEAQYPERRYYLIGRRFSAGFIDTLIWAPVFLLFAREFGQLGTVVNPDGTVFRGVNLSGIPFLAFLLLGLTYNVLLEWHYGGTVGKLALGIEVKDEAGSKLTFRATLIRNVMRILDGFPFLIPYVVGLVAMGNSDKRQRLGDRFAHTIVLKK